MTLRDLFQETLEHSATRPAVLLAQESWTYGELWTRCLRRVAEMRARGLGKGDRVAALLPNSAHYLELYLACALDGLVLVPLNLRLHVKELATILQDAEPRLVYHLGDNDGILAGALESSSSPLESIGMERACESPPILEGALASLALSDPAQIYYTSGTTGRPKGVVLSHGNVLAHARAARVEFGLTQQDVWGHFAPMFHLADAWACFAVTLAGGAHCFLARFEASRCFSMIKRHRVTLTNLVPTMLQRMVSQEPVGERTPSALRLVLSGGAPIAPELVARVQDLFACEYVQTYGLTETSPFLTVSLLDDELRALDREQQFFYASRTGRAFAGVDLRVVGEDGALVPKDDKAVGEIQARGDSVFKGYWKQDEATREAFEDGWFLTGDLATIEARGFLNIVDRKKDIILTGGETVYSTEVENAIYTHQRVESVAVFPIPDRDWGELVAAAVVLRDGERELHIEELAGHCRLFLAPYKVPRVVYFVDQLPLTGSGKVQKRLIRERCLDKRGERIDP